MNILDQAKKKPVSNTPKKATGGGVPTINDLADADKKAVDKVRQAITAKKKAEADLEQYGGFVIELFLEQKESEARAGNFRKSFKFAGNKETVMVKHSNRALKINYDDVPQIKKILSKSEFKMLLEENTQMFVKDEVLVPDSALGIKLWNMLGKNDEERDENFNMFFESKVELKIKDDFDRNIFRLPMKAFNAIGVYIKLIKPALQ